MKPTDLNLYPLEGDLIRFEEVLDKNVSSELPLMRDSARYLVLAGGKRLRPALSIASAYAISGVEPTNDYVLKGACAIELVHAGSLHHDDVIDNALSRRAIPSVNVQFSNSVAILSGDYLLALASSLAASLGAQVSELLAQTISQLCIGQIIEQQDLFNSKRTTENYLKAIEGKTASLFASSCKIGATVSDANDEATQALNDFGYNIGMAFQIIDDLLDITSDEKTLGKPTGHDIEEGVYTLPVIFAAEKDAKVRELLGDKLSEADFNYVLSKANESEFVERTFKMAQSYGNSARAALDPIDINSEVKEAFMSIAEGLLNRSF